MVFVYFKNIGSLVFFIICPLRIHIKSLLSTHKLYRWETKRDRSKLSSTVTCNARLFSQWILQNEQQGAKLLKVCNWSIGNKFEYANCFNYRRRSRRSLTSSELTNTPFSIFGQALPAEFLWKHFNSVTKSSISAGDGFQVLSGFSCSFLVVFLLVILSRTFSCTCRVRNTTSIIVTNITFHMCITKTTKIE